MHKNSIFCTATKILHNINRGSFHFQRLRDETVKTSHKIDLVLIAEIRSKKLLMIVLVSSLVALSALFRTVWTMNGAKIYKSSTDCKFTWSTVRCFPDPEDLHAPVDEIEVVFNRDTTIFMFNEAIRK